MNEVQEALSSLLITVLTVTVPILLKYLVVWLKGKIETNESDLLQKYLDLAVDAIYTATMETTQTYVDELKDKNMFDKEAQKEAMRRSMERAKELMGEQTRKMLESMVDDVNAFIQSQIESIIAEQHQEEAA